MLQCVKKSNLMVMTCNSILALLSQKLEIVAQKFSYSKLMFFLKSYYTFFLINFTDSRYCSIAYE